MEFQCIKNFSYGVVCVLFQLLCCVVWGAVAKTTITETGQVNHIVAMFEFILHCRAVAQPSVAQLSWHT